MAHPRERHYTLLFQNIANASQAVMPGPDDNSIMVLRLGPHLFLKKMEPLMPANGVCLLQEKHFPIYTRNSGIPIACYPG
jgi:hypothetical protein